MSSTGQTTTVSEVFHDLENWSKSTDSLSLKEIVNRLGEQGLGLIVVVLSVPFLQPVPLFGLSTIIGAVMMVVGLSIFLDRKPWIPEVLGKRQLPKSTIIAICNGGRKVFSVLEKFVKPRGSWIYRSASSRRISGLFIFLSAALLALPIPIPGTNTPPAAALLLLSLGFIENDGYAIALGYLFFWATVAYFIFLAWASYQGLNVWVLPFFS